MTTNKRSGEEEFRFGPRRSAMSETERAFWDLHAPVVKAWIDEMKNEGNEWWPSAEHAALCLVDRYEPNHCDGDEPQWNDFDVPHFLFHDLHEGGTVGLFGSVAIFFDQIVEAFERFLAAGIIDADKGARWLDQLRAARPRFLDHYHECEDCYVEVSGATETLQANRERDA